MDAYSGRGVTHGVAFGTARVLQSAHIASSAASLGVEAEWKSYLDAKTSVDAQLCALYEKALADIGEEAANIIDVQRVMLQDADFDDFVQNLCENEQATAAHAVHEAGRYFSALFAAMDDEYMRARQTDVIDISERLKKTIQGVMSDLTLTTPSIVFAEDLTPSETLQLDKSMVAAFVIQKGSATSHTAILARTLGIPCIIRCGIPSLDGLDGMAAAVDGGAGMCYVNPDESTQTELSAKQQREAAQREQLLAMKGLPTVTTDGRSVKLFANIGSPDDIPLVLENDSEGIGLFRSEFLYLGRKDFPSEEEQFVAYKKVVEAMGGRQVVIRTLDIGADKQADYLGLDAEENPALGLRGIRVCIERADIFTTQLRAIYRASAFGNTAIMFPMIASCWELNFARDFAHGVRDELTKEGIATGDVEIGIMIETPAAVMIADDLAKTADFFSVGTNDLTQYTLALDRQNSKLERYFDPHHPAVMTLLGMIASAAKRAGISAGICGELAADLDVTKSLVDMGFDKLSVSPTSTLALRRAIREV